MSTLVDFTKSIKSNKMTSKVLSNCFLKCRLRSRKRYALKYRYVILFFFHLPGALIFSSLLLRFSFLSIFYAKCFTLKSA